MKGAIAELCANTIRPPKTNSTSSMGVNHHHLVFQKNLKSSPMIPVRLARSRKKPHSVYLLILFATQTFLSGNFPEQEYPFRFD